MFYRSDAVKAGIAPIVIRISEAFAKAAWPSK
jgi:hypothetical protein